MNFIEIENALGQRLATLSPAYPIAWPNKDYSPQGVDAVPYIEFRHVPTIRTDDSIDGGHEVQTGIALFTAVVNRDGFSNGANEIIEAVKELFYYGLRITTDNGFVMVTKPADPVAGFVDGVYWRQPLRVTYRTAPSIPGYIGLNPFPDPDNQNSNDGLSVEGGNLRVDIEELPRG